MTKKTSTEWHGCPIRYGASIFGDNWCLLILRDLMFKGARHYADFLNAGEGIASNILAARLGRLEAEGIITKRRDPDHGVRRIYLLTDKGLGLIPAMLEIIDWSEAWDKQTDVPTEFAETLRADRKALAQKIATALIAAR
ncbi:MAG: helix-turn-helix transcriptional regulator [Kordiimonadaceae bacterium]|nr:helix-turn-helix transcriptional regulator [Kordiimonadaceae bacterium]